MLFVISMFVNVGMWLERFEIVVTSLHRDFLPSSWGMYWPTRWDLMTFFGTIGLFIDAVLPVHPRAADDFDLRDADDGAGGEGEGSESALSARDAMDQTTPAPALYGVMAEFEDPTSLVEAARRDLRRRATRSSKRTRRFRSMRCSRRCTCTTSACRSSSCSAD